MVSSKAIWKYARKKKKKKKLKIFSNWRGYRNLQNFSISRQSTCKIGPDFKTLFVCTDHFIPGLECFLLCLLNLFIYLFIFEIYFRSGYQSSTKTRSDHINSQLKAELSSWNSQNFSVDSFYRGFFFVEGNHKQQIFKFKKSTKFWRVA